MTRLDRVKGARRRKRRARALRRALEGPSELVLRVVEALAAWGANVAGWRPLLRWETVGRRRSGAFRRPPLSAAGRRALLHSGAVDREDPAWRGRHPGRAPRGAR